MNQKNLIIICITVIICVAIFSFTALYLNNHNSSTDSSNDSINITLNGTDNNTTSKNQTVTPKTKKTSSNKKSDSDSLYISGNPEDYGYVGVGEGIYRNKKTGKVYEEHGRGNLKRAPELDNYEGLAG